MTVIAWDGSALAADKRAVSGGGIARACTKIERHGGSLLGITGDWDTGAEMREWFKAGALPAPHAQPTHAPLHRPPAPGGTGDLARR